MHNIKLSILPALGYLAVFSLFVVACQKKFDPNSYKPAESFGGYSAANQIEPGALVAHFAFENSLVDSVSNSSANNYGTSYGTGVKGSALQVGLNNYAIFPATQALQGLQSMTVAFWMTTPENPAGIQESVCFVNGNEFWGNFDMFLDGQSPDTAVIKYHIWNSVTSSDEWMTSWILRNRWSVWTHFVLTYDATTSIFTYYQNGSEIGSATFANAGPLNFKNFPDLVMGTSQFTTIPDLTTNTGPQPWASYLLGSLDELRIYNKALSGSEVLSLYQLENYGF